MRKTRGSQVPARGSPGCIFVHVGVWRAFRGSQGGLCASPFPSTMLLALWFQIRTTSEQPEAGMGLGAGRTAGIARATLEDLDERGSPEAVVGQS